MRVKAMKIARKAYAEVPIYCQLAEKMNLDLDQLEFEEIPIVDKSSYVESGISCLSSRSIGDYLGRKLQESRTSGSTGKFSEVYWNPKDYRRSLLELWMLRKRYYGIWARDRVCYFYPSDAGESDTAVGANYKGFSRNYIIRGNLEEAYEEIVRYAPVWMILQPSVAILLCDLAEQEAVVPKTLRYIEFTGEYLDETVRKRVEEVFCCQTANQYGTKEVNSIAYECPEGSLHILSDNVYLETVETEGVEELCVTTLRNYAMPFIRFNIEDRGSIDRNVACTCGRCGDILSLRTGRANDWIQRRDGSRLHAYVLMQTIHHLNYLTDGGLLQYQICQKDYDEFDITLVIDEEEDFETLSWEIEREVRKELGEQTVIHFRKEMHILPAERTGKLACFVSDIS